MSARRGKIARLAYEEREELNRRLRDGQSAAQINRWLVSQKIVGAPFSDQNITNWRKGGYQDWLREQAHLDKVREKSESLRRKIEAGGMSVLDDGIYQVATAIVESMSDDADMQQIAKALVALKRSQSDDVMAKAHKLRAEAAEKKLALDREKFELIKARADQADRAEGVATDVTLSTSEKERRIKEIFGIHS